MGHLINPVSVRLGFSTFWISSWSIVSVKSSYSYFALLDNVVIELISYFFYHSAVVGNLAKFGFFFSHFRLVRRHLGSFCIKLFFVPKSSTVLPKTFVELGDRERFKFASLLGFKFLRLSRWVQRWVESRTGRARERRSLFRLKRSKYISGGRILMLKERKLFSKNVFSWRPEKKKRRRLRKAYDRFFEFRGQLKDKFLGQRRNRIRRKYKKFYAQLCYRFRLRLGKLRLWRKKKPRFEVRLMVVRKGLLSRLLRTSSCGSAIRACKLLRLKKKRRLPRVVVKKLRMLTRGGGSPLFKEKISSLKQKARAFLFSKVKTARRRFLTAVSFARLRRANSVLKFFKYLTTVYSELVTESFHHVGLFQGLSSKTYSASLSFSVLNKFKLLNPQFISRFIAKRLTYGMPLRRVLQPIVVDLTKNILNSSRLLQGFRIKCSGRFSRAQMASVMVQRFGRVSLSSVSSLVSMGYSTAFLRYGACGIKVWLSSKSWIANSSSVNFNKLNVLKLLNNVVLLSRRYFSITKKPCVYGYLLSFFILNLMLFSQNVYLEKEEVLTEKGETVTVVFPFGVEESFMQQFFVDSSLLSNSILFSFLRFRKWLRKDKKSRRFVIRRQKMRVRKYLVKRKRSRLLTKRWFYFSKQKSKHRHLQRVRGLPALALSKK